MVTGEKRFQILYLGKDILVLFKPWNVPLDGPYERSVEKWICNSGMLNVPEGKTRSIKWIHQLDRPTSGILCVAFSREVASCLAHCFEARSVYKEYSAIILGHLPLSLRSSSDDTCHILKSEIDNYCDERQLSLPLLIDVPVGTDDTDQYGYRMKIYGENARNAYTEIISAIWGYFPASTVVYMDDTENCNWIEYKEHRDTQSKNYSFKPETGNQSCLIKPELVPVTRLKIRLHSGRKHQIRVHLAQVLKQPILHDILYGGFPNRVTTQSLERRDCKFTNEGASLNQDKPQLMLHAGKLFFPIDFENRDTFPSKKDRKLALRTHNKVNRSTAKSHIESTENDRDKYPTKFFAEDDFPSIIDC